MSKFRVCSVQGCDGDASRNGTARGFCINHYRRWQKYGDPLGGRAPPGAPAAFIQEAAAYKGSDCLIWPYARDSKGYGVIVIDGKNKGAHRAICELVNGLPPCDDSEAAHSCGSGHLGCVTPQHIRWDTKLGNAADRIAHGKSQRGETHGANKLTEDDVRTIRGLRGQMRQVDIAAQFGVSQRLVSAIINRQKWAWLE